MPSSDFRVAHGTLARRSMDNLQYNLRRLAAKQDEVSSMKKLRRPSDSPVDTVSALRLRADLGRNTQVARNIDDSLSWLGIADDTLSTVVDEIIRVRDLAITARNASADSNAREGLALEVDKI